MLNLVSDAGDLWILVYLHEVLAVINQAVEGAK